LYHSRPHPVQAVVAYVQLLSGTSGRQVAADPISQVAQSILSQTRTGRVMKRAYVTCERPNQSKETTQNSYFTPVGNVYVADALTSFPLHLLCLFLLLLLRLGCLIPSKKYPNEKNLSK
jgi:hypothetical protein